MRFTKMQGAGNDYICVEGSAARIGDPSALARAITDRHFGVGADGLILILPSDSGDARMRIFNADGSEAEMCGNGIRCLSKYVHDRGLSEANPLRIETGAGLRTVDLELDPEGNTLAVTVDMGEPVLKAEDIPVDVEKFNAVDVPLRVADTEYRATCVSMGNPHAVIYVDDVAAVPLERIGPQLEHHERFPRRANIHFVQVLSRGRVRMRTWERGSGMTLACGTGACAVCVAGVIIGRTERQLVAHLPGGDLELEWRQSDDHVLMTGPAVEVFTGDWPE